MTLVHAEISTLLPGQDQPSVIRAERQLFRWVIDHVRRTEKPEPYNAAVVECVTHILGIEVRS